MAATVVNESGNESLRETGGSDGNRHKRQKTAVFSQVQQAARQAEQIWRRHRGRETWRGGKGLKRAAGWGEQETSKAKMGSRGVVQFARLVVSPEPESIDRTKRFAQAKH